MSIKIIYNPGTGNVTLTEPTAREFSCGYRSKVNDNLATSGLRERVFEASVMVIGFTLPEMVVGGTLTSWDLFMSWALQGGTFDFYPNSALSDHYHCQVEDDEFSPARIARGRYSATLHLQIVPDDHAPGDPTFVLQKFYGV